MPAAPTLNPLAEPTQNGNYFTFNAGPLALPLSFSFPRPKDVPTPAFTFSLAPPDPPKREDNPLKRRRRLTDVDGDLTSALLRKKRRLRLTLITSRLSQPYSYPATNIIDRGGNKAAVLARYRRSRAGLVASSAAARGLAKYNSTGGAYVSGAGMPEPLLRKAAMLNRLRLHGNQRLGSGKPILSEAEAAPLKCQLRSQEPENMIATEEPFVETTANQPIESPNMNPNFMAAKMPYAPQTPSPLGMTNYDALDLEDDYPDDEDGSMEEDDSGRRGSFYSDFSVFGDGSNEDDDAFGSIACGLSTLR